MLSSPGLGQGQKVRASCRLPPGAELEREQGRREPSCARKGRQNWKYSCALGPAPSFGALTTRTSGCRGSVLGVLLLSTSPGHHSGYAGSPLRQGSTSKAAGRYLEFFHTKKLGRLPHGTAAPAAPNSTELHLPERPASNVASTKFSLTYKKHRCLQSGGTSRYLIGGFETWEQTLSVHLLSFLGRAVAEQLLFSHPDFMNATSFPLHRYYICLLLQTV